MHAPASTRPTPEHEVTAELQGIRVLQRADWNDRFPWLLHGVTTRGFDMALRSGAPVGDVMARWDQLQALPGVRTVVHARQIHGSGVRVHDGGTPGLHLVSPVDGHLTRVPGVLLAVSVADCVPVFLVSEAPRAVSVLHAGWRGVAAGILDAGFAAFRDRLGVEPSELHLHLGPAISEPEYEVSPEVHRALGEPDPGEPSPLDLRRVLSERAVRAGVLPSRIGVSARCTRTDPLLHSHRGGDSMRQVAFAVIREAGP
ncbi:MAG: laccase domain-containing protein [Gemmatimonadales bacterium]|nr:MAG: laccase domain-containing protein [Gemmatimonadales bacterium]